MHRGILYTKPCVGCSGLREGEPYLAVSSGLPVTNNGLCRCGIQTKKLQSLRFFRAFLFFLPIFFYFFIIKSFFLDFLLYICDVEIIKYKTLTIVGTPVF